VKLDCVRVTWFDRVDKASVTVIAVGALSRSDALFAAPLLAPQLTDCQVAPEAGLAWLAHTPFARSFAACSGRGRSSVSFNQLPAPHIHTHAHTRESNKRTHPPTVVLAQPERIVLKLIKGERASVIVIN
jgi:hypothetical protein